MANHSHVGLRPPNGDMEIDHFYLYLGRGNLLLFSLIFISVIFMGPWEMHLQNFSGISSTHLSSRFSQVNKKASQVNKKAVLVFDFRITFR